MIDPRYPVGRFTPPAVVTTELREEWLRQVEQTPSHLRAAVSDLSEKQLQTPYREGGWTVRQVVHHVADSHMNSYIRFRLALTEDEPTIKPYAEERWAELADGKNAPIELSLALLDNLHARWMLLMQSFEAKEWARSFLHPALGKMSLEWALALYAWHGRHHVGHVLEVRNA